MKAKMRHWSACGLGLLLLAGMAATPAPAAEEASEDSAKSPNVEVNVVQYNRDRDQTADSGTSAASPAAVAAPAPAASPGTMTMASVASSHTIKYMPDASRSLGTENLLSEMCREIAGKIYYELKEGGEKHLTSRVAVVAAVPLSDLKRETEFGRMIAEYLLTDIADRGLKVSELRMGKEINILPQTGEFIMTRNIGELANDSPMLDYVVVSTFTNTRKTLIVQGRLVSLQTGLVETSWRYTLPLNRELLGLFHEVEEPYTIAVKGMR